MPVWRRTKTLFAFILIELPATKIKGHRCKRCDKSFTVRNGTIFENSRLPLRTWIYAIYLLQTARKGVSSLQLSKELDITQKSAWFMLHRLREACATETLECALHDNITRRSVICTDDARGYHGVGGLYAPIGQSQRKRVC